MNAPRTPQAVQTCHDLLIWLIPLLDQFPKNRRFTLGERLESGILKVLRVVAPGVQEFSLLDDRQELCFFIRNLAENPMRFHRWLHLWTLVLLFTVHSLAQAAPPCDKSLEPVGGKIGYQSRDAVRCEGLYASNVSSPPGGLDLVGLTRGAITFAPHAEPVVKLIPVATDQAVRVLGVGIPVKTYYRLDALIPPAGELEWRLADVVGPLGLRPDQVGLVAYVESDPRLYLSLRREQGGAVTLLVRPSDSATEMYWRSAERRAGRCGKMGSWVKLDAPGGLDRGAPGRIELPAGTAGDLCLEAQAVPSRGSRNLRGLWHIRTGL